MVDAKDELMEWLGLTPADALVTIAVLAAVGMFFLHHTIGDASLAAVSVILSIVACPLGMKSKPTLSRFSNVVKKVTYPACVVLVVGAIVVHYVWFNA